MVKSRVRIEGVCEDIDRTLVIEMDKKQMQPLACLAIGKATVQMI
jgi:hypothetical protein